MSVSVIALLNLGSGLVVRVRCLGICHRNQHPPMCLPLVPVRPLSTRSPKNHRSPCWHLAAVARPAEYWEGLFHSSLSDGYMANRIGKAPENVSFTIRLGNVSNLIRNANILPPQSTPRHGFSSIRESRIYRRYIPTHQIKVFAIWCGLTQFPYVDPHQITMLRV